MELFWMVFAFRREAKLQSFMETNSYFLNLETSETLENSATLWTWNLHEKCGTGELDCVSTTVLQNLMLLTCLIFCATSNTNGKSILVVVTFLVIELISIEFIPHIQFFCCRKPIVETCCFWFRRNPAGTDLAQAMAFSTSYGTSNCPSLAMVPNIEWQSVGWTDTSHYLLVTTVVRGAGWFFFLNQSTRGTFAGLHAAFKFVLDICPVEPWDHKCQSSWSAVSHWLWGSIELCLGTEYHAPGLEG